MKPPLAIELFCGSFGWSDGWLELGGRSVGFDIDHQPYHGPVPRGAELVIQDVMTLHGSQFKNADLILASPPCQEFSYQAMPWKRAKQIAAALRGSGEFPEGYTGSRTIPQLTALFDACFRIQREASGATAQNCPACGGKGFMVWYVNETHPCERCDGKGYITRYIPMVVENVKGAQPWVGRAKANFGSFYLWGDVAMVGNRVVCGSQFGSYTKPMRAQKLPTGNCSEILWKDRVVKRLHNDGKPYSTGNQEVALKVPGFNFHEYEKTGKPGRSFQTAAVDGVKGSGGGWYGNYADQKASGRGASSRQSSSHSQARKAASAQIAKIPLELSRYVARSHRPRIEATA